MEQGFSIIDGGINNISNKEAIRISIVYRAQL